VGHHVGWKQHLGVEALKDCHFWISVTVWVALFQGKVEIDEPVRCTSITLEHEECLNSCTEIRVQALDVSGL
jgi:hypothetical protein